MKPRIILPHALSKGKRKKKKKERGGGNRGFGERVEGGRGHLAFLITFDAKRKEVATKERGASSSAEGEVKTKD